ncbi:MAG: thioredoxin family protein [Planctomycetales bacterium]|nr:thioredoxin family protein [Planctomycetales bacterium]
MVRVPVFIACALVALSTARFAAAGGPSRDESAAALGRRIDDFALPDDLGRRFALGDFAEAPLVVVVFLGVECPLAQLYAPQLAELNERFAPAGVTFLAVDSNRQDSLAELAHFARQHELGFPLLKDAGAKVAQQFGAVRTPQAFVLDRQRVVRYVGRIDDRFGFQDGLGYQRPQADREDLAVAIDELLAGGQVSVPVTRAPGCLIGRVLPANEQSPVTYARQISRLFARHCLECHRDGEVAPFAMTSYEEVAGWAPMIAEVVGQRRMPPWHAEEPRGQFIGERRLSTDEVELVERWVAEGAPLGDPAELPVELPEEVEFADGMRLDAADRVIAMSEKPFTVPARGLIDYQYFLVDPGFSQEAWVQMAECVAGNRRVVHHIIVFVVPPETDTSDIEAGTASPTSDLVTGAGVTILTGFSPGMQPWVFPAGTALHVPAGSKLVFQMHYTPAGSPQQDLSSVRLVLADPAHVERSVTTGQAFDIGLKVPAGACDHRVEATHEFTRDTLIYALNPHMHLRGKSFRFELEHDDGRRELLLDVPRYDFNWRPSYYFVQPRLVAKGSRLCCTAVYDNSAENLANPDPTIDVAWGTQTTDEMMIGWFIGTTDVAGGRTGEATRTAQFVKAAGEAGGKLPATLRQAARTALANNRQFEAFGEQLAASFPQVDRADVVMLDGDQMEVMRLAQSPVICIALGSERRRFSTQRQRLAVYALGSATAVHDRDAATILPPLSETAAPVRSSVHVPMTVNRRRCVVNFWSRDAEAFPGRAVAMLEEIAAEMSNGAVAAQRTVSSLGR